VNELVDAFALEAGLTFLNHGSFGACPRAVLEAQRRWRDRLEADPVRFFVELFEPSLAAARDAAAALVGVAPEDLVFVRNATEGVNAVLRSLSFEPGDELLTLDQGYPACHDALRFVADRSGARVVEARLPWPLPSDEDAAVEALVEAIEGAVGPRTRLALLDHVTSPTGVVLPVERLVPRLEAAGVPVLVDGAHAPGMLDLRIAELGASYYAANFHKHTCAPKGAAMLWVRPDRQAAIHPPVISHGYRSPRDRKRLLEEFDWTGTGDPTPWLVLPEAFAIVEGLGGPRYWERNRAQVLRGRALVADALAVTAPVPEGRVGTLAALPLPPRIGARPKGALSADPVQRRLRHEHGIQVPIVSWPGPNGRLVRLSAHLYNDDADYARLAEVLPRLLAEEG
jgi:isopenicillin-N epimerase